MDDSMTHEPYDKTTGTPPTNKKSSSNRAVFTIVTKPGDRKYWVKIGIAHINRDDSWNVYLDALPLDGKLQIREEKLGARGQPPASRQEREIPSFDLEAIQ
jgi:hypothetical protein